jgi:ABC-type dipeptide/oligopeptide/nickel transport system permease component
MAAFVARRIGAQMVLVLLAASLVYLLAAACLHPRAELEGRSPRPPRQVVDAELARLGLDDRVPLPARYAAWAARAAHGDLGRTVDDRPVAAELRRRLGASMRLLAAGAVTGTAAGVALGGYGALRRRRPGDLLTATASFAVLAVPAFVLALLLQQGAQWLDTVTGLRIFGYAGEYTPGRIGGGGVLAGLGDRLRHLVLPTLTVALGQAALCGRYQRAALIAALHADHVPAAVARGVRRRTALVKYALLPSFVPVGTYAALQFGLLLTCAVFVERGFGWHGVGEWLVDSVARGDVNAVAAIGGCAAAFMLAAGLFADILAALLDPRVRRAGE